jgi:predicted nuclease of predicted toxin-antitoxin system
VSFLVDENISRRLCRLLEPTFPGCRHVAEFGLLTANDEVIHARALAED